MTLFSRTDRSFIGEWWWTVDRPMLAACLALIAIGVMMITTAGPPVAETVGLPHYHFLKRHLFFLVPTVVSLIGLSMLQPQTIWRIATALLIGTMLTMLFVLFFGAEIKGSKRWLHIFGFSIQPSEFIKPSFVIISAWLMALNKKKLHTHKIFNSNLGAGLLYALVITLLVLQPDFGMSVVVTAAWLSQIFLAGLPFRFVFALGGLAVAGAYAAYALLDHVQSRINRFLDPESGDTFQVQKSLEAFQNGGFAGTGPGQGTVKLHLPDAHADFIFSVAGEELGLIFVIALIALYGFIVLRGFNRLMDFENIFVVLAAGGLLTVFGLQAMVHMGSALSLLPAKGMTLPFVSYGGSSLVSMGIMMGAVLALTKKQKRYGVSKTGLSLFSSSHTVNKSYGHK